jgi:two-component system response regulator AtoC
LAAPQALILDRDSEHTRSLKTVVDSIGFQTIVSAGEIPSGVSPHIAFLCLDVPGIDVASVVSSAALGNAAEILLMADEDDAPRVRRAIGQGATYFFCKPFDREFIEPLLTDVYDEIKRGAEPVGSPEIPPLDQFGHLRGSSPAMRKLYRILRKVAPTDASILLIGESGTGKELAARTLHEMSDVSAGPFVAMNCAAVPKDLFESELFGHEKGSFSGADRQHQGYFERAMGGTLFLDELAEMPIELQAKLLRVLEVGAYRRVGGESDQAADVRIVAATNRDPEDAIAEDLLREDLYYRIARFPIWLPPLRSRATDIEGLAQFFVDGLNEKNRTAISIGAEALEELRQHTWPGNVRELRSAIERAFILSDAEIGVEQLPDLTEPFSRDELRISVGESIDDAERKLILATLEATGGDKQAAADMLGLSVRTLYNRLSGYETGDAEE